MNPLQNRTAALANHVSAAHKAIQLQLAVQLLGDALAYMQAVRGHTVYANDPELQELLGRIMAFLPQDGTSHG